MAMPKVAALSILGLLARVQFSNGALIRRASPDLGVCTEPTIMYVENQDGMLGFGYKPTNNDNFPHGASPDIRSITDFICSNLQNVCRAPTESVDVCKTAAAAADGKEGQDAADAFNNAINASPASVPSNTGEASSPSVPSDVETAQYTIHPTLNMKFSKEYVDIEGHIDPVWWINEYLKADGQPALCDETPHRMPNDLYITFSCEGADPRIVPMMKEALIAVVKSTIDSTSLSDEERIFKHRQGFCFDASMSSCERQYDDRLKSTLWPQAVHVATAIDIPGAGGALSGNLRYTISKSAGDNCKMCGFLATSGGSASTIAGISEIVFGTASLIAPGISILSASVSFACMTSCG
ncbi:hypothetical protein B0J13DRAFT_523632 [Dactylonectria estremocensis]|uniref:Uncharacterized protein n=1 Tax=Dactylonectria estremocensis TaxID=1079267 RepID=A0A9P9EZA5_9HYPO|nr:hypothetical protein B0J13DRAFT_523632 [Dactylonectria estremocensis]